MTFYSPVIRSGDLQLTANGQLQDAPDIETQCTVTLSAYNCIYNDRINSALIPYLNSIPNGGWQRKTITNIIKSAFQPLITEGIISDIGISIISQVANYFKINIAVQDSENNTTILNWSNA